MRKFLLNPQVSFLEKNFAWALYLDYGFIIFREEAAGLFSLLMEAIQKGNEPSDVPDSFLEYLLEKQIILEVSDGSG